MANKTKEKGAKIKKQRKGISAGIVILLCFILAECIYNFVFGDGSHFIGGSNANQPLQGDLLGTVYKGGMIVPVILTMLLTVLTLSVERYIAIRKSRGTGDLSKFVATIKDSLENNDMASAKAACAKQKGSVANVVISALDKYEAAEVDTEMNKEQKVLSIQKTIEEATALEMPTMEQNLPVIAAMTTLGTLIGLLGTVTGMIKSFASLASAGGTDSVALSVGISEALINTAFGIATGASAVIAYSFFTGKIDNISYAIDEIGFSIVNVFSTKHK